MLASCPPAIIAKILSTLAVHRIAASYPLDPKVALGTLFEFRSLCKDHKGIVYFPIAHLFFVFLAGQAAVKLAAAAQAVLFQADRAIVFGDGSIELEDGCAACSWAPGDRLCILLNKLVEAEGFVFLFQLGIDIAVYFLVVQKMAASVHRAFQLDLVGFYLGLQVGSYAFGVKHVPAVEDAHLCHCSFETAYLALYSLQRPPLRHKILVLFQYTLHALRENMHEMLVPLLFVFHLFVVFFLDRADQDKHTGLDPDQAMVVKIFEDCKLLLVDICPLRLKWQEGLSQSETEQTVDCVCVLTELQG